MQKDLFKFRLGQEVKDVITGFQGIITILGSNAYGDNGVTIQPQTLKDGKPGEAQTFDESCIVAIENGIFIAPIKEAGDFIFQNGDEVKHKDNRFTGKIRNRYTYNTGCNAYRVKSPKLKKGQPVDSIFVYEEEIELKKITKVEEHKIRTGGPQDSVPSSQSF